MNKYTFSAVIIGIMVLAIILVVLNVAVQTYYYEKKISSISAENEYTRGFNDAKKLYNIPCDDRCLIKGNDKPYIYKLQ